MCCSPLGSGLETKPSGFSGWPENLLPRPTQTVEKTNLERNGTRDLLPENFIPNDSTRSIEPIYRNIWGTGRPIFELLPVPSPCWWVNCQRGSCRNVRILPTFGTRRQYLRKFSRSRWPVSYHWPINHCMDYRATKRLPTLARNFFSTAQWAMGVTVFMIASYRNAEGEVPCKSGLMMWV